MDKVYKIKVFNTVYISIKKGDRIKVKNKIKKTVIQDKIKTDLS